MKPPPKSRIVVIISANVEWRVIRSLFDDAEVHASPLGEWFVANFPIGGAIQSVVLFHGGWGKIAAAASTQYVIDQCEPSLIVNLGTCGGFDGEIERGTVILVDRVIVYDILEQMGDHKENIAHYTTAIDLAWLKEPYPHEVLRTRLVSADRDLVAEEIPTLKATYGAVAGDWESGSVAWVASRNGTSCLILRGVTDLVGKKGGDAYGGNIHIFEENTLAVMKRLVRHLPAWIERFVISVHISNGPQSRQAVIDSFSPDKRITSFAPASNVKDNGMSFPELTESQPFYDVDLAHIHDVGFGGYSEVCGPGLLTTLQKAGIHEGLVIDLGCGSGIWAEHLTEAGYRVLGIDFSPAMIALARQRVPTDEFHVGSVWNSQIPRCRAVTALGEVLCYRTSDDETHDLRELFQRIYQSLDPGGC